MFGNQAAIVGESSGRIRCPREAVFRFIADDFATNYPRWSPEVEQLQVISAGELDEDWLARQTRVDHGHRTTSTFRVTELRRPARVVFTGVSSSFVCTYDLAVANDPQATDLTFRFEFPRLEMRMRPFRKLIQTSVQEGAERTVRNLRGLVEQEVAGSGHASPAGKP